ncbi:hypothetical protein O9H85_05240 [Paenibacillus filicis]|uniref:HEPN domain-containing protein n=1 Tax=Paenibacillus gyeongsangnamensis TaxID=3388067 RepID=A0ABT4Q4Q1_9BACL|nr:hypothetical protein [Paenibacillus filicis]MCZ8511833.1 hypothetical protein [Paenibacillus filicis]
MELKERLTLMKAYETDCYSYCHYLLQREDAALEAAKQALCRLIRSDGFFEADPHARRNILRKESIAASLQVRKKMANGLTAIG